MKGLEGPQLEKQQLVGGGLRGLRAVGADLVSAGGLRTGQRP